MKKVITAIFTMIMALNVNAQKVETIELTPEGISGFRVLEVEGKTASELYTLTKEWAQITYTNPDYAITGDVENKLIKGSVFIPDAVIPNNSGHKMYWSLVINYDFKFKDGKIKYTITDFSLPRTKSSGNYDLKIVGKGWSHYIFKKKDGSVKHPESAESINVEFNNLYSSLEQYINKPLAEEDW